MPEPSWGRQVFFSCRKDERAERLVVGGVGGLERRLRPPIASGEAPRISTGAWSAPEGKAQTWSSTHSTGLRGSIQAGDCRPDHNFPNRVRLSIPRIRQRRTCRYRKYSPYPGKCRRFLRPLTAEYEKDAGGCQDGFAEMSDSTGRDSRAGSIAPAMFGPVSLEKSSVGRGDRS